MSRSDILVLGQPNAIALARPPASTAANAPSSLKASVQTQVVKGYAIIAVFVVGFGIWAALAPLAGGAIATGVVSPDGNRRVVQHLEGGIVQALRVKDGDVVKKGDPLIVLDSTLSRSKNETLNIQRMTVTARLARLEAERDRSDAIKFPIDLYVAGKLHAAAEAQKQIFDARRASRASRNGLLNQRIEQLQQQIGGQQAQIDNVNTQLSFIREEVDAKQTLLAQGLLPKPEALRLKRSEAELLGRQVEFETSIGALRQQIQETQLQVVNADKTQLDEIETELEKTKSELADLNEKLRVSEDVLQRTTILSPVNGAVINMRVATIGGVIQGGEPLLEIVPNEEALIIDAHVLPNDIHRVHIGQTALVQLSAYTSRTAPRLEGVVRSVSADSVRGAGNEQSYYLARLAIDEKSLQGQHGKLVLVPGMGAQVIFVTENRTLLDYLIKPLNDSFRTGLREQ